MSPPPSESIVTKPVELTERINKLEKDFELLVDAIEESFSASCVSLEKILKSIKHIPRSLRKDLGTFFQDRGSSILNAQSKETLFFQLSFFWDYLNPGLLEFIVGRFGSEGDIALLKNYLKDLEQFQEHVKLGDYIQVKHAEISTHCQKITAIMGPGWEDKTLQDAIKYKHELAKVLEIQPFLARVQASSSSVAITFCLPHWIKVELKDELKQFLKANNVTKAYLKGM